MNTTLSLQPSHYFILLVLVIIIISIVLFIKWLFKKETSNNKKISWLIIICVFFFLWVLSFYNKNYSVQAQTEKEVIEKKITDDFTYKDYNPRTKFYNLKDFNIYNFKNIIETPIPNYLDVKSEDDSSVFFEFRDDLIEKKKNINLTGIGITVEPKKSNLTQDNFSTISDVELNSFLTINETMIKAMLPSWGLSEYKLTNSSVTTKISNFGVHYLETSFEFDNNGKKLITYLSLIPRKDDMIRLLTVFFLENEKDMLITMENIKLVAE